MDHNVLRMTWASYVYREEDYFTFFVNHDEKVVVADLPNVSLF